jgi:hypothetical protein
VGGSHSATSEAVIAVYVIAIVVVVLLLVGAYRALGAAPPRPDQSGSLLTSLHATLRESLAGVAAAVGTDVPATQRDDRARDGRRATAAVQQTLDRLPPAAELDDSEAAARELLAAAAEDTAWAWRMLQAGGAESPGVAAAVTVLADHAADCCDQALRLLTAAAREPVDSL